MVKETIKASNFNLSSYLKRIRYEGDVKCDIATLSNLMRSQLQSVPFENTEVQAGEIPSLEGDDIVEKIIFQNHGGYCYEINGLFAMALNEIGFEWYFAGARPMLYPTRRPKTHLVVIVDIDNENYLCDTGFGGYGLREPLKIQKGEVVQGGDVFRLEQEGSEYILSALVQDEWQKQYGFALRSQEWIDFSLANYFNATNPNSIFTQKRLAMMQTPKGRKILVDNELKLIENGKLSKLEVNYEEALLKYFNVKPY